MNRTNLFFILNLVLLVNVQCSLNNNLQEGNKHTRIEKHFLKIDTSAGKRNVQLDVKNKKWNMRVSFPEQSSQKKRLIIGLHWAGGGDTYQEFSRCLLEQGMQDLNAISICPDAESLLWHNKYNEEKILTLINLAIKFWDVNPNEIIVMGYSNGGIGSWFFADKHADLFKAAIPMASVYYAEKKIKIPMYVIHGENDELFSIEKTQNFVELANKKGSNIHFAKVSKLSHYEACNYVAELKNATQWLLNEVF